MEGNLRLYHFTCWHHWPAIQAGGLCKGDVPITPSLGMNAVWFTTDEDPAGHGLSGGEPISPKIIAAAIRQNGRAPANTHWPNKRAIRITVDFPDGAEGLHHWPKWSAAKVAPPLLRSLERNGGGPRKAETWWLYFGTVPPADFAAVDFLAPDDR